MIAPFADQSVGDDGSQQTIRRPRHGGDGRNAKAFVDLGSLGVVDAGDDGGHTELFAGDSGGDDVRVVAVGDGGERVRLLDPGLQQGVSVESDPEDLLAMEIRDPAAGRPQDRDR